MYRGGLRGPASWLDVICIIFRLCFAVLNIHIPCFSRTRVRKFARTIRTSRAVAWTQRIVYLVKTVFFFIVLVFLFLFLTQKVRTKGTNVGMDAVYPAP